MTTPALAGLNIVVTRPREQAAYLAQNINRLGGHALLFPLLEIEPTGNRAALHERLSRLHQFDLAIFISTNAVRFALPVIGSFPSNLQIATIGPASAAALRQAGIQNILVPHEPFDSESLLALPELRDMKNKKVVIFRGEGGRELLAETLTARGASVEYAECYRRIKPPIDISELRRQQPDAITVSSSEGLRYLSELTDSEWLYALPLFVPHPRIATAAQQFGWQHIIKTASGDDELLSSLVGWSQHRRI